MSDFKRGFVEELKPINNNMLLPDPRKLMYGSRDRSLSQAKTLKRDTQKIKTNPKYKCVDECSDEGEGVDHSKQHNDDPG